MDYYIYLVCTAHSGSTLIAFLLGNHPQIATVGELAGRTDYDGYRCSCGHVITDCPFWINVKERVQSKGISLNLQNFNIFIDHRRPFNSFDRIYDHYFPTKWMDKVKDCLFLFSNERKNWINGIINKNILLSETIAECLGKENFLDTTKDLYRLKHLIIKLKHRLKILYLTRDGRGVMNSLVRKENMSNQGAINAWLWSNDTINRVIKSYCEKNQVYQFKYEDLCSDLESKLMDILEFIGVSTNIKLDNISPDQFHIIGNVMRKSFTGKISLDEKWRNELNEEQLSLFEKKASKMNKKLAYM